MSENEATESRELPIANPGVAQRGGGEQSDPLLPPEEHVLSTLEKDGSRRWLRPHLATGAWWKRRRIVAYVLMLIFVLVPHLRLFGKPLLLFDFVDQEVTVFGKTFLPTDTVLLALLMLSVFLTIVLVTAIAGRAWCGWACPQTVYMEFLFRPIDRIFDGTAGKGGKAKKPRGTLASIGRIAVYVILAMFLAHTFLAYFVGTDRLAQWVRSSPAEHPGAFFVMGATTGLMLFDFLFFREQLCLIACPYGRFQSAMLDEQSLVVAYDHPRGEPRKKGKHSASDGAGDCVDCNRCVVVCPTGIDIRDGLQMECINCTQCIDACDDVMERVGKEKGLIRYSSQDAIAKKPRRAIRPRTVIYPIILFAVLSGLAFAVRTKSSFDAQMIRGKGAPFTLTDRGTVTNSFNLNLVNRTEQTQVYQLEMAGPDGVTLDVVDDEGLELEPREKSFVPVSVEFPLQTTRGAGKRQAVIRVTDESENSYEIDFKLLGPK